MDLTNEERQEFKDFGIGFAPRGHAKEGIFNVNTLAMLKDPSKKTPMYYYAINTRQSGGVIGSTGTLVWTRGEAEILGRERARALMEELRETDSRGA